MQCSVKFIIKYNYINTNSNYLLVSIYNLSLNIYLLLTYTTYKYHK